MTNPILESIAIINDVHLGRPNLPEDGCVLLENWLYEVGSQHSAVVINGDLVDSKLPTPLKKRSQPAADLLRKFMRETGVPVHVNPGNHCVREKRTERGGLYKTAKEKIGVKPHEFVEIFGDMAVPVGEHRVLDMGDTQAILWAPNVAENKGNKDAPYRLTKDDKKLLAREISSLAEQKPTALFTHIPCVGEDSRKRYHDRGFFKDFARSHDNLRYAISGHVHSDVCGFIKDSKCMSVVQRAFFDRSRGGVRYGLLFPDSRRGLLHKKERFAIR